MVSGWHLKWLGASLGLALCAYGVHHISGLIAIGAAHKAKVLCSAVFVSERDVDRVLGEDLAGVPEWIDFDIDGEARRVTTWFGGVTRHRAIYRPGLGCTLLAGVSEEEAREQAATQAASPTGTSFSGGTGLSTWGDIPPPEVSPEALAEALEFAFAEPDPAQPRRTRAVVVLYRGRLLAERYAAGVGPGTPLPGWSMAKSVTNAVVGILVGQGRLDLYAPAPVPEWQADDRSGITLHHLLTMTSGLEFDDRSGPVLSDVNRMLLLEPDAAAYAARKPLEYVPGTHWSYSGGTTNILSRIVREAVGGTWEEYWRFPGETLFDRIGMTSAVWEPDAQGHFVGSSYVYATARDWGRFGLLYLQDGRWGTDRILPEGWVRYTITPTPAAPDRQYGAHFWLYWGDREAEPSEPPVVFYASGYEGQYVVVMPERDLVIVRLGQTPGHKAWDMAGFVKRILDAIGL